MLHCIVQQRGNEVANQQVGRIVWIIQVGPIKIRMLKSGGGKRRGQGGEVMREAGHRYSVAGFGAGGRGPGATECGGL